MVKPKLEDESRPSADVDGLIDAARAQDDDAIVELIRRNEASIAAGLQAAGLHRLDPLYEDAQSQALLTIWQRFPSFRGDAAPGTWMYQIAKRTAMSRIVEPERRERRRRDRNMATTIASELTHGNGDDEVVDRDLLRWLLTELDARDREILLLRVGLELSTKETARLLHLSEGGVKTRLRRAKRAAVALVARGQDER